MRAFSALLARIVDYAGLYPPASLALASAVRAYAAYRAGPAAWMLGRFVNVFVAAALATGLIATMPEAQGRQTLARILSEEDAAAFAFDDEGLGWRGHRVDLGAISQARTAVALSFGSCSFDEPVEESRRFAPGELNHAERDAQS